MNQVQNASSQTTKSYNYIVKCFVYQMNENNQINETSQEQSQQKIQTSYKIIKVDQPSQDVPLNASIPQSSEEITFEKDNFQDLEKVKSLLKPIESQPQPCLEQDK